MLASKLLANTESARSAVFSDMENKIEHWKPLKLDLSIPIFFIYYTVLVLGDDDLIYVYIVKRSLW